MRNKEDYKKQMLYSGAYNKLREMIYIRNSIYDYRYNKQEMDTKVNTQEMTETQPSDLPQDSFQLADHPWLAADVTVEDEIRYALDEIRL